MLSDISIKRPVFAWMLMFGLILFGAISLSRLGISYMPDIDFPQLEITVNWDGAAPEILEAEIVDKIEEKIIAIEGLQDVRSSIRQGQATITLDFEINRNIDAAVQEVQTAVSQVRLPLNVDPPIIKKSNPEEDPVMWIGVSSTRSFRDLAEYVDLYLKDQFQTVPGVGEVLVFGFSDRNLRVWLRNEDLKKYELTVLDVVKAVEREHTEIAGGYIENSKKEINVRTMGEGMTAEQFSNILITQRGGQPIYNTTIRMKDVARVEDGLNDIRRIFRIDGKNAIGLGIKKQRGSNEVAVAQGVHKRVDEVKKSLPQDIQIRINVDFTGFVEQSVHHTEQELLYASIITAIICFLFLGTWSSSINVLMSIPTSIVGTFTVIYFMGFTLNLFTMLALTLVIGVVVDDAIMVLENIVRHFHMGKGRVQAAREGAREITFAAVAASIAVMAIFLPVAFMSGIIGKFFFQFGVTISAAVALSLLEAITLTPMRCSKLMRKGEDDNIVTRTSEKVFHRLSGVYLKFLQQALRFRWPVVIVSMAIFVLSLFAVRLLRQEFVPTQDQNFFRIAVTTPVGSSLAATEAVSLQIEEYIKTVPEVDRYLMSIGGITGQSNTSFIPVVLKDKKTRSKSQTDIVNQFRADLGKIVKGSRLQITDLSARGLTSRPRSLPIEFNIRGVDYKKLKEASEKIMKGMEASGLMTDVDSNYKEGMPELRINPDREAAARRGVSMDDLGTTINGAIGGIRQGKFTNNARRYDVRLRLEQAERLEPETVNNLQIRTSYGEVIPLSDIVKLEVVPTVQTIGRINRQRAITISSNLAPGVSQSKAIEVAEKISRESLPEGYTFNLEGGSQAFQESFNSLWFTMLLGILVAYMILASQFNSFLHPIVVLLAMPFSVTGAFLLLLLTGQSVNLFSMIGLILLFGIVKKNSILLVEFTNQVREEDKLPVWEALLKACPIRLRPILMTSAATIGAAIPTAMSHAPGSEARVPMALTIIGGVTVSTFFTLFVVPCAYLLFSRLERHDKEAEEQVN